MSAAKVLKSLGPAIPGFILLAPIIYPLYELGRAALNPSLLGPLVPLWLCLCAVIAICSLIVFWIVRKLAKYNTWVAAIFGIISIPVSFCIYGVFTSGLMLCGFDMHCISPGPLHEGSYNVELQPQNCDASASPISWSFELSKSKTFLMTEWTLRIIGGKTLSGSFDSMDGVVRFTGIDSGWVQTDGDSLSYFPPSGSGGQACIYSGRLSGHNSVRDADAKKSE